MSLYCHRLFWAWSPSSFGNPGYAISSVITIGVVHVIPADPPLGSATLPTMFPSQASAFTIITVTLAVPL
eukprot:12821462-Alexandrium_andersonii.AAC.1